MSWWETLIVFLVASGAAAALVRTFAGFLKGAGIVKKLALEEAIDRAAEFAVCAIEHLAKEHGLKGNEKFLGAAEIARKRIEKVGVSAGEDEIKRSVGAAYERLKGDLHACKGA